MNRSVLCIVETHCSYFNKSYFYVSNSFINKLVWWWVNSREWIVWMGISDLIVRSYYRNTRHRSTFMLFTLKQTVPYILISLNLNSVRFQRIKIPRICQLWDFHETFVSLRNMLMIQLNLILPPGQEIKGAIMKDSGVRGGTAILNARFNEKSKI